MTVIIQKHQKNMGYLTNRQELHHEIRIWRSGCPEGPHGKKAPEEMKELERLRAKVKLMQVGKERAEIEISFLKNSKK